MKEHMIKVGALKATIKSTGNKFTLNVELINKKCSKIEQSAGTLASRVEIYLDEEFRKIPDYDLFLNDVWYSGHIKVKYCHGILLVCGVSDALVFQCTLLEPDRLFDVCNRLSEMIKNQSIIDDDLLLFLNSYNRYMKLIKNKTGYSVRTKNG